MENNVANVAKLFKNDDIKKIINEQYFYRESLQAFNELSTSLNLKQMDIRKFYRFFSSVKNIGFDTNRADKNDQSGFNFSSIKDIIQNKITPAELFPLVQAHSTEWTILLGLLLGEKIEQEVKRLSELETNKLKDDKSKTIEQMAKEIKDASEMLKYLEDCLLFKVDHTQFLGRTSINKMQNDNDQQGNKAKNNLVNEYNKLFVNMLFNDSNNESKDELVVKDIKKILKFVANSRKTLFDDVMNKQILDTSGRLAPAIKVWSEQFKRLKQDISLLIDNYQNKIGKNCIKVFCKKAFSKKQQENKDNKLEVKAEENKEIKDKNEEINPNNQEINEANKNQTKENNESQENENQNKDQTNQNPQNQNNNENNQENKETNKEKEKKEQAKNELKQKAESFKSSYLYPILCNFLKEPKKVVKHNNDRKLAQERLYHNKDTNKFRKQRLKNIEERKKELFNTDQNGKIIIGTKKISPQREKAMINRLSQPKKKPIRVNTKNSCRKLSPDEQDKLIKRLYYEPMEKYKHMGKDDKSGKTKSGKTLTNLRHNKTFITELKLN